MKIADHVTQNAMIGRAARPEPLQVVVSAHLIEEYLPLLTWQSTVGAGDDPLRLPSLRSGSMWGIDDRTSPDARVDDREAR